MYIHIDWLLLSKCIYIAKYKFVDKLFQIIEH